MFDDSIFPAGLVRDLHSSGPRRRGHLAHKWAHTPMIRVRLVTQFRADHPCDQHQCVPNGTKRSSTVQLRSGAGRVSDMDVPHPSVVTVAAIATFPSGAIACSSWTPPSVCRPTRWICSLANSGDFAANRYPVTVASAWEDMNASNSRVAVNGPWVTSPGYPSTSVTYG